MALPTTPHPLYINNAPLETGDLLPVHSPWDGALVGRVHRAGATEVEAAIAAAVAAAPHCAAQPAHARAALLRRLHAGLEARREEFVAAIVAEAGKPVKFARGEVDRGLLTLQAAAEEANRIAGEVIPLDWSEAGVGKTAFTKRVPIGPVLGISPFNFPLNLMLHKIAPAIAAGCPILHKPASAVPLTAALFAELVRDAAALPGQIQILPMAPDLAQACVQDERLAALSFTGSPEVGWRLKALCGQKKITLELGGNAAAIIEADADLERALQQSLTAGYAYAGQVCISLQRLFVHESVFGQFAERFVSAVAAIPCGDPAGNDVIVGPLITAGDVQRVHAAVQLAIGRGATCLTGGAVRGHQSYAPTVLTGVPADAEVAAEEIFGPVVVLESYGDFEEAIARVNASQYGLQAAVYTASMTTALRAHAALEVAGVMINQPTTFRVDSMPYGGVKSSGFGREGIRYAIAEYTEPRLCVMSP